jgi:hypothetical protein
LKEQNTEFKEQNDINEVYYVNENNQKIYVDCNYKIIINELTKLGIYHSEITIDALIEKFDPLLESKFAAIVKDEKYLIQIKDYNEFHNKIRILYLSVLAVSFYLYDYDATKMPCHVKRLFTSKYR